MSIKKVYLEEVRGCPCGEVASTYQQQANIFTDDPQYFVKCKCGRITQLTDTIHSARARFLLLSARPSPGLQELMNL